LSLLRSVLLLVVAAASVSACTGADPTSSTGPSPTPSTGGLTATVISTDLGVGWNRLAFALLDVESSTTVREPQARVALYSPTDQRQGTPSQTVQALFRPWPLGELGVYSSRVSFDRQGEWGLTVSVTDPAGNTRSARTTVRVKAAPSTPAIGAPAPPSRNKTSRDVSTLAQLTSAPAPDPDLYTMTIQEALASRQPLVVVFATPAFCRAATCGPQVEVISEVKERFRGRAGFIHVEIFDNPDQIQGDLSRAITAPAVAEWGLQTEPWTFIVDRDGRVAAKFEAFATASEIEEGLSPVLE
jgi:hypothetical protein